MAKLSKRAEAQIDSLSEQELRLEIEKGRASRFQREKFAYLKVRLAEIQSTRKAESMSQPKEQRRRTWRERVESHPFVYAVVLFSLGFSASEWTMHYRNDQPIESFSIATDVEALTSEHNRRLAELHAELSVSEQEAVRPSNMDSSKAKYVEAAQRIRTSISEENTAFETHLNQMMRIVDHAQ